MRTADNRLQRMPDEATSGGSNTQSLFEQYYEDSKKTLKNANKALLKEDIKMTLTASVHNANKSINRLNVQLNELRSDIANIDFEAILEVKDEIRDQQAQIDSAKEEYALFFGETMA